MKEICYITNTSELPAAACGITAPLAVGDQVLLEYDPPLEGCWVALTTKHILQHGYHDTRAAYPAARWRQPNTPAMITNMMYFPGDHRPSGQVWVYVELNGQGWTSCYKMFAVKS